MIEEEKYADPIYESGVNTNPSMAEGAGYRCSACGYMVPMFFEKCVHCGAVIRWGNKNKDFSVNCDCEV